MRLGSVALALQTNPREGYFVDQYSTYISGVVPPGATRLFKVSCGCKDSPPAKHDNFKVQVVDGGY
jgi:hypothetical protein